MNKQLANIGDPLELANGIMIDPETGLPVDCIAVPNALDAIKAVTKTRLKLVDLPAPPAETTPIAVILFYRTLGLSTKDISIAIGFSITQIDNIIKSETYSRLQDQFFDSIKSAAVDDVRTLLAAHSKTAANTLVTAASKGKMSDRIKASDSILDRSGHRPVDVHEHHIRQESTLRIEYVEAAPKVPTIDLNRTEYVDGDSS